MIGTTRSRVSFFMNRFRKLGFINYDGGSGLQVPSALFNIILHDENLAPPEKKEIYSLIDASSVRGHSATEALS
jgi:CRP/FNR family cyclic AMP-dependent transcriptional regulator